MPQRSLDQIAHRRATVAQLHLRGLSQQAIACQVGVTQSQVSQDLVEIRRQWHDSTLHDFNQARLAELARIDQLEAAAWQAFYASAKPAQSLTNRLRDEPAGVSVVGKDASQSVSQTLETVERIENRLPDPRYLVVVGQCIDRRCRLLGLAAPLKLASTAPDGEPVAGRRVWVKLDYTGGRPVPQPDAL